MYFTALFFSFLRRYEFFLLQRPVIRQRHLETRLFPAYIRLYSSCSTCWHVRCVYTSYFLLIYQRCSCKKGSPYSIKAKFIHGPDRTRPDPHGPARTFSGDPGRRPGSPTKPAGDVNHKPGGRLPLLSAGPAVTPATLKKAVTNFAAW